VCNGNLRERPKDRGEKEFSALIFEALQGVVKSRYKSANRTRPYKRTPTLQTPQGRVRKSLPEAVAAPIN
jgi:hypothetical protein